MKKYLFNGEKMNIHEKLSQIQSELKAPKSQYNSFGKYNYRSLEDITEAIKPFLQDLCCYLTMSDKVLDVGGRVYIQATATLHDAESESSISVTALAREAENKKGMDDSQITGAASSYARKYACNGLFAIDDTKDADATQTSDKKQTNNKKEELTPNSPLWKNAKAYFKANGHLKKVLENVILSEENEIKLKEEVENEG